MGGFRLVRPSVLILLGLAGQASQSLARGAGPDPTYAVVCKACDDVVAESRTYPTEIDGDCDCGHTTKSAWESTTLILEGVPCPSCRRHLYYKQWGAAGDCRKTGSHVPRPLHERAWA